MIINFRFEDKYERVSMFEQNVEKAGFGERNSCAIQAAIPVHCRQKTAITLGLVSTFLALLAGCSTEKSDAGSHNHLTAEDQIAIGKLGPVAVQDWLILEADKNRSSAIVQDWQPLWNPTTNLVTEALKKLPDFLQAKKQAPQKLARMQSSYCQAVGITFGGERCVFLNFGPTTGIDHFGWAKQEVRAEYLIWCRDCGPQHWEVIYLPKDKTFTNLHYQGWF